MPLVCACFVAGICAVRNMRWSTGVAFSLYCELVRAAVVEPLNGNEDR